MYLDPLFFIIFHYALINHFGIDGLINFTILHVACHLNLLNNYKINYKFLLLSKKINSK